MLISLDEITFSDSLEVLSDSTEVHLPSVLLNNSLTVSAVKLFITLFLDGSDS